MGNLKVSVPQNFVSDGTITLIRPDGTEQAYWLRPKEPEKTFSQNLRELWDTLMICVAVTAIFAVICIIISAIIHL